MEEKSTSVVSINPSYPTIGHFAQLNENGSGGRDDKQSKRWRKISSFLID
jgi:hypothetical protein